MIFFELLKANKENEIEEWLSLQMWFGSNGDMEHLRNFWLKNFKKRPNFKPSHIVPNLTSIIRCMSDKEGFAVVPDFLCKKQIENKSIQLVWEGFNPLENHLYFVQRKKTIYEKELAILQKLFREQMSVAEV